MNEILNLSGKTVLIVDDDQFCYMIISRALKRFNINVKWAKDAFEALGLFEKGNPGIDLIITDYEMPGMCGDEMTEKLRGKHVNIPIIFHTASLFKEEWNKINTTLFDEMILKPTNPGMLREIILKYLVR